MKQVLLMLCAIVASLACLWFSSLRSERLSGLRGIAQLIHLPDDFFASGGPIALERVGEGKFRGEMEFSPKYAGRYQVLVTPVVEKYGTPIAAHSVLSCAATKARFQVANERGRVEFDKALNLGFVGRLLTFDTSNHAEVGATYRCELVVETTQDLDVQSAYIRKLTDV